MFDVRAKILTAVPLVVSLLGSGVIVALAMPAPAPDAWPRADEGATTAVAVAGPAAGDDGAGAARSDRATKEARRPRLT